MSMHAPSLNFGETGSDSLIARRPDSEMPEFDITAMVDLVFMMNIYFLVTFVAVSMGQLNLPSATHVAALDADTAVIFTLTRSADGKSVNMYVGDSIKTEAVTDTSQQEERVQAAVTKGAASGKKNVLLKAEKKVRLGDMFRIASDASAAIAATSKDMKLNIGVLEKEAH
jgi:biopolymer transport protein ExbD